MNIERFVTSDIVNNTYIAYCPGAKVGIVIDPSYDVEAVLDRISELQLDIRYIVNTHRHCDHIAGNAKIKYATKAHILIHELDAAALTDPNENLSSMVPPIILSPPANRIVTDGEKVVMETKLGPLDFEVWHTPGHSPGHICLKFHRGIFTGDLLFEGSIGRTDFPGCNPVLMKKSLTRIWNDIPESFEIFPGHNEITVMQREKKDNYLFRHMVISDS